MSGSCTVQQANLGVAGPEHTYRKYAPPCSARLIGVGTPRPQLVTQSWGCHYLHQSAYSPRYNYAPYREVLHSRRQDSGIYITKGDANPSADAPVIGGLVQGKMVWHVPYLGQVLMWAKTWIGIAILVYLPCLIVMIGETRKLAQHWKRLKPYSLLNASNPYHQVISMRRLSAVGGVTVIVVSMIAGLGLTTVSALQDAVSNTVMLGPNTLTVHHSPPTNPPSGDATCTTTVNVNNSSTQTATSGNATNTGNTNGGSATSGSATNTNNSSTSVTVTNGNCSPQ